MGSFREGTLEWVLVMGYGYTAKVLGMSLMNFIFRLISEQTLFIRLLVRALKGCSY